jgi:K+-transporting ATPase c subunit
MKDEKQKGSVTKPLLKDLVDRQKADSKIENPSVGSKPLPPPDLYQDSGSGYNPDFTFPQE